MALELLLKIVGILLRTLRIPISLTLTVLLLIPLFYSPWKQRGSTVRKNSTHTPIPNPNRDRDPDPDPKPSPSPTPNPRWAT